MGWVETRLGPRSAVLGHPGTLFRPFQARKAVADLVGAELAELAELVQLGAGPAGRPRNSAEVGYPPFELRAVSPAAQDLRALEVIFSLPPLQPSYDRSKVYDESYTVRPFSPEEVTTVDQAVIDLVVREVSSLWSAAKESRAKELPIRQQADHYRKQFNDYCDHIDALTAWLMKMGVAVQWERGTAYAKCAAPSIVVAAQDDDDDRLDIIDE